MKHYNYYVAIASLFNGTNTIYKVRAIDPEHAKLQALADLGWDISEMKDASEATDELISEPILIQE